MALSDLFRFLFCFGYNLCLEGFASADCLVNILLCLAALLRSIFQISASSPLPSVLPPRGSDLLWKQFVHPRTFALADTISAIGQLPV